MQISETIRKLPLIPTGQERYKHVKPGAKNADVVSILWGKIKRRNFTHIDINVKKRQDV